MELHDEAGAVRREIVLAAGRAEAWAAVCDLGAWLAEEEAAVDLVPGAEGTIDGRAAVVEEVEPARRIALRWWPPDAPDEATCVELTLDDVPRGTRLVVVELPVRRLVAAGRELARAGGGARGPMALALA